MKRKILLLPLALMIAMTPLAACSQKKDNDNENYTEIVEQLPPEERVEEPTAPEVNEKVEEGGNETSPQTPVFVQPKVEKITYLKVTGNGVNLRRGAGTGFAAAGVAEKNTLFAYLGNSGNWYKTLFKGKEAYIYADYCTFVSFEKNTAAAVEKVIEEGCKYMGVKYVYGATRYMDGNGNRLSGFSTDAFDCSSLMQYIFKKGADVNLQVNTRTQIYQGKTVKKSELKRGDLMFFTNASRKNNKGVERVGHVALYLGEGFILHTASDYAKIEKISSTRWGYFIQGQRVL